MVRRIGLLVEYDGADFYGWQRQDGFRTVQGEIERSLGKFAKSPIEIHGSGRTDKGVHARGQFAHFDWDINMRIEDIPRALNGQLPGDIVIREARELPMDFHSRYHCKGKMYCYRFYTDQIPRAMENRYAMRVGYSMDMEKMRTAAQDFIGTYDFKGFTSARCDKKDTIRTVYYADLRKNGSDWEFVVAGSGFLYNMVRIMVGTLIDIGRGRLDMDTIERVLETKDRTLGGKTVGPQGLTLERVFYSDVEREKFIAKTRIGKQEI